MDAIVTHEFYWEGKEKKKVGEVISGVSEEEMQWMQQANVAEAKAGTRAAPTEASDKKKKAGKKDGSNQSHIARDETVSSG